MISYRPNRTVNGGRDRLLQVPDNQKFIDTIIGLLAEKDKLRDIGLETSQRAREHYSWDKTADAWLKRIDSCS